MLSEKMLTALNNQINAELYSAYLYLAMSSDFTSKNLSGFANWIRCQAMEEQVHAMKLYDYVRERGGRITLTAIDAPPREWESPLASFEAAYQHEVKVTGMINNLVDISLAESDHATHVFLQWFVSEQVEEEASTDEVVQKLKLMGDAPGGIFIIDSELARRVFAMPANAPKK